MKSRVQLVKTIDVIILASATLIGSLAGTCKGGTDLAPARVIGRQYVRENRVTCLACPNAAPNICEVSVMDTGSRKYVIEQLESRTLLSSSVPLSPSVLQLFDPSLAVSSSDSPILASSTTSKSSSTSPKPATIPASASKLSATANSSNSIQLRWSDNSNNETGFLIERKFGSGSYESIITTGANYTSYVDNSVSPSTTYTYRVTAVNSAGAATPSNEATATTLDALVSPTDLKATVLSGTSIALSWSDSSNSVTGFQIQRSMGSSTTWSSIATLSASETQYTDTGLTTGTAYNYRVVATDRVGATAPSNTVTVVAMLPPAPASALIAAATSPSSIQLTWSDDSDNESGFIILRQLAGSSTWATVTTIAANSTSFTDTGLTGDTQYTYEVLATNAGGNAAPSNIASATTPNVPKAASNLTQTVQTATQIQISWKDNSSNETGFKVERSSDGVNFNLITTLPANTTTYTDTNLNPSTSYSYLIIATNEQGDASPSNITTAATAAKLTPGTGFTGATAQPAATGTTGQLGYGENAIARWDVVPYQIVTGEFNVGVTAFDISGIKEVDFSVNGGPWTAVTQMTLNPQTANHTSIGNQNDGVVEYWTTLNAADFQDGQIEIRAIAVPNVGVPRVLQGAMQLANGNGNQSLYLYSNSKGSFSQTPVYVSLNNGDDTASGTIANPFKTITKALSAVSNGGTIILEDAGQYAVGSLSSQKLNTNWITIKAADGLTPDQVVISQPTRSLLRPEVAMLKWSGVSFDFNTITQIYPENGNYVWFDGCEWTNSTGWATVYSPDQLQPVRSSQYIGGSYVTNSLDYNQRWGFVDQTMVRGSLVKQISNDAYTNTKMTINSAVDTMALVITGTHNDIFQYYGTATLPLVENVIDYNVNATNIGDTQDIFLDHTNSAFSSMAFVNITVQNVRTNPPFSQLASSETNILFLNVRTPGQSWALRTDLLANEQFVATDVLFAGCTLGGFLSAAPAGVIVQ